MTQPPKLPLSRRSFLSGTAAAAASVGLTAALAGCTPEQAAVTATAGATSAATPKGAHVVLLGISGGPGYYPTVQPAGPSTAIVVGGATYLVDLGDRAPGQFMLANPNQHKNYEEFSTLRAVFLTHLHSDHVIEYFKLFNFGWWNGLGLTDRKVKVLGPGRRKTLTPAHSASEVPDPASPSNPMPGTVDLTDSVFDAFATDINDRVRDNGFANLRDLIDVEDIVIPGYEESLETLETMPDMDPFALYEDELVKVSATLVNHFPIFPAFAYRFDTAEGSVVLSGDTGPSANLIRLAKGADMLIHEAIDDAWVDTVYKDQPGVRDHLFSAHTSASKLGAIAEEAGVSQLVLNHLVPSEPPLSRFDSAANGFSGTLHIGKDLDKIPLRLA